ncbi:Clp protease N-terminal domain-containing protein [Williamsia sp. CHRR-6]|uniref:Clp protease N-terminal domain-containing protein n=1 Tax=Williamsia sp. CHRR-6 TaxID=2835871 RepID=UPI001BDA3298|nr:Clp protease N-terminal domain-containing protein [Williamsia sp. CHRR-6]MBT0565951.1 Clp protease N-terminal domain-containing protein [Williamsia sp. CHRR-6]
MFEHLTREARHTLGFAMEEAADLGHTHLGPDHLILGMLCNARSPLFELLTAEGFTLNNSREKVREIHSATDDYDLDPDDDSRVQEDRDALRSIGIDLDAVVAAIKKNFGADLIAGWGERGSRGPAGGSGSGDNHRGGPHRHGGRGGPRRHDGRGGPHARGSWGDGHDHPRQIGPWEPGRGRRGPRGRGGPWGRPRFSGSARAALSAAVASARTAGGSDLTSEGILMGILDAGDAQTISLIESVTTVASLREMMTARI